MSRTLLALLSVGVLALAGCGARDLPDSSQAQVISGPYALLLAASADLGDSRARAVQLTVELRGTQRPDRLQRWAAANGLSVRWQPGAGWAVLQGPPAGVAAALGVPVRDYRKRSGERFYASPEQPAVPAALADSVAGLGRILSYTPYHSSSPSIPPLPADVPDHSLPPDALRTVYNARPLADAGYTGKNTTIVVFAFDGFDQADLDMFAQTFGLPKFTPEVVGGMPEQRNNEASMDLQVAHAMAPDAHTVLVNARPTVEGGGTYVKIAEMMADTDRRFPGAVWSLSIGWGCDRMMTAADLAPVREAVAGATSRGTTVFNASGDLAGLECKRGHDWSAPPGPADVGLDAIASLPEVTTVGGTSLSTDERYQWLAENGWSDGPLTQGSGGGVSALFDRPSWQTAVPENTLRRLTPDISAVADTSTGAAIVLNQQVVIGGGTSQAAPLWAGIAAVLNQFLIDNGGRVLGQFNPTLYRIAAGATRPAFHDIVLGTNAVAVAGPGYDMVTGLGSPNVDNLARDVLDLQRGVA
ncbi:S53 family peptidase [Mycobacterium sp. CVI_P3]|uniref:S53 family peptidase n=1 Tax=Mycobacterium pinniadriaticum TaxID=2994102 RepID=A0ABT3SEV5_9MYCO|nr:S53 family peptidase [Mycobacterium pinniadriaticum]MCX2931493.1 S53 family peptidase [Mycobacterium pinniadriaticum]MCX2937917.1 S53 family peptidase [Mycobacterium pinniadriaticum]